MAADTRYPSALPAQETVLTGRRNRISWGAILAGFFCAIAVQAVLTLFGLSWGLGTIGPTEESQPLSDLATGGGVYWTVTSIVSLFIGGWISARLAAIPYTTASVIHGVSVWALTTLLLIFVMMSVFGVAVQSAATTARAAAAATGSYGETAASVISEVNAAQLPTIQEIRQAASERNLAREDIRQELWQMSNQPGSRRERQPTEAIPGVPARELRRPRTFTTEISIKLNRMFVSPKGELRDEDRNELVSAMSDQFDISERQAERIVNRWQTQWEESTERLENAMQNAQQQITKAAEDSAEMAAKATIALAIASVLNLIAAAIGAGVGRIGLGSARHPAY